MQASFLSQALIVSLFQNEGKYDKYCDKETRQNANAFEIFLDHAVIRVELKSLRRIIRHHWVVGSSIFFSHFFSFMPLLYLKLAMTKSILQSCKHNNALVIDKIRIT